MFILSKLLDILVSPLTWLLTALVFLAIKQTQAKLKRATWLLALVVYFFHLGPIANSVMKWWEPNPVVIRDLPKYKLGIVLTGITNTERLPTDRIHFEKGADRIVHALTLYRKGKIKQIFISGGSGDLRGQNPIREATELKAFLVLAGVPDSSIITETESRNTRENAVNSVRLLKDRSFNVKDCILITSAFHMPRAKACFQKEHWDCATFPTDYYSKAYENNPANYFLPRGDVMRIWSILFREWTGIVVYKLLGYT